MQKIKGKWIVCGLAISSDLNTTNFVDTIHVGQTTYNFPNYSVEPRAQTSTSHNAGMDIICLKVHLKKR